MNPNRYISDKQPIMGMSQADLYKSADGHPRIVFILTVQLYIIYYKTLQRLYRSPYID